MLTQQKYALGAQFLEEMKEPAETRVEWKKMGYGGKVSSKKHFRVSQCQEGVRTMWHLDHNLDT